MFVRRLTTSFKEQHWATIVIELVIVIIGVFVGNQVSNWNEARIEKKTTARMLDQLGPELQDQVDYFESIKRYYQTTHRYADVALAGWSGDPRISDDQFVIAAYQASQIYGANINAQNWTLVFGGDQLRNIDDPALRRHLALVLTTDYSEIALTAMQTRYRDDVRLTIPNDVQTEIREHCGDRMVLDRAHQHIFVLPAHCALQLPSARAAVAASALRAHPALAGELALHLSTADAYLQNVDVIEVQIETLEHDLGGHI